MFQNSTRERRTRFALIAILILGFFLRVFALDKQSLWYDELATWQRAVIPFADMMADLLAVRNHVPLYFILMQPWALLGESEFVLRYFSVIWGTLGVALIYPLGRLFAGRAVGLLSAFLLAISPFQVWYSQEARMYTLVATAVLLASWFLVRLLREDRRVYWVGYAISMLVAVYVHYLVILIFVAHYTFFAIHYRRLKSMFLKWLIYAGGAILLFALWAGYIMLTGGFRNAAISWIEPARLIESFFTLLSLGSGPSLDPASPLSYLAVPAYVLALGVVIIRFGRRRRPGEAIETDCGHILDARLLLCWLFVPVLILYLISLDWPIPQRRSIYVDRYLIIVLPALILTVSWGLSVLAQSRRWRWLVAVALFMVVFASGLALARNYFDSEYGRDDWRAALAQLETTAEPGDVILARPDHILPLTYYTKGDYQFVEIPPAATDDATQQTFDEQMSGRASVAAEISDRAWLITHFYNNDLHGFPQERNASVRQAVQSSAQEAWMNANFEPVGDWSFTGIHLALYDLSKKASGVAP
jgi:mannosyltransferase